MRKLRTNVNVKTTLKAGQSAETWMDSWGKRAGETVRSLPAKAQAMVTAPQVREAAAELMWWPIGSPPF